jgi:(p)ppGpp synthase/HD superfamily hydrolase
MEPWEIAAVKRAADIAVTAHAKQYRGDGTTPFILHPARVAGLVAMFGGRYQEVAAAWLHDVLERDRHGEKAIAYGLSSLNLPGDDAIDIYRMVKAMTRDARVTEEKQLYDVLDRILDAPPGATLVKLCERMDNILDPGGGPADRKRYTEDTIMVLAMLFGRAVEFGYAPCHETLRRCLVRERAMEEESPGSASGT